MIFSILTASWSRGLLQSNALAVGDTARAERPSVFIEDIHQDGRGGVFLPLFIRRIRPAFFMTSSKPKLLDLFCGVGGCTKGYQRAGFWVRGVDHKRQPRYCGDQFIQADALEYLQGLIDSREIEDFSAIHASPPCQFGSQLTPMAYRANHPNLIPQTRALLRLTAKPYVIENVKNVRIHLDNPLMLYGH